MIRREFLKLVGLTGAAIAFPGGLKILALDAKEPGILIRKMRYYDIEYDADFIRYDIATRNGQQFYVSVIVGKDENNKKTERACLAQLKAEMTKRHIKPSDLVSLTLSEGCNAKNVYML